MFKKKQSFERKLEEKENNSIYSTKFPGVVVKVKFNSISSTDSVISDSVIYGSIFYDDLKILIHKYLRCVETQI